MKELMLGNEALACGARDAGIAVVSAYPGTPSTEITETIARFDDVYAEWAANEKVAAEVAMGACVAGARAMCCMKHVGLNVCADVLFTAAYAGVNAALVFVVADDPGMHSSQNEQDTRMLAAAAHVPVLEPSDSQEAYDFMRVAVALSEEMDLPVIVRMTTRISHSRGFVERREAEKAAMRPYQKNPSKYVMMPAFAKGRRASLFERMARVQAFSDQTEINCLQKGGGKIGVLCSGTCYQYAKEALPQADILKLGMTVPLPRVRIEAFAKTVDTLYIIEELEPAIEQQVRSWGIDCIGSEVFPKIGELSVAQIRHAIYGEVVSANQAQDLPPRPPALCAGCPHRATFRVLNQLKANVFGDIGCYTLGALAPLNAMDSTICMGASIGMAHGAERAQGREFSRKSVAVIGDSTFFHSGLTGLASAAYNQSNITILVLDNSITGMTGHQDNPATGKTLKGLPVKPISIEKACYALGAQHVRVVNPIDQEALKQAIVDSWAEDGVSVVIPRMPCVMIVPKTPALTVDPHKCTGCGVCIQTGCPALQRQGKLVSIDAQLCNGCGLCQGVCRFGSIGGTK